MIIGYTTGVFDLFHIGHLNLLRSAKGMCDKLIVGVTVDNLAMYKHKKPISNFFERIEIVRSCRYVDVAIPQYNLDKLEACRKLKANIVFVGDDWYGNECWIDYEEKLLEESIRVMYFPYTEDISSTKIFKRICTEREGY